MIRAASPALPVLLAVLSLTACASGSATGPSLLPRAIEEQGFEEPAAAPAPVATPDAALDGQIAGLVARRTAAETAFAAADRAATAALAKARGAAVGSEGWLDAQIAIAALDEQRASLLAVLTELEQLAITRAAALQPAYPALDAARIDAEVALDRVTATVAERKAALPL